MFSDYYLTLLGANQKMNDILTTSGSIVRGILLTLSVLHISSLSLSTWQLILLIACVVTVLDVIEEVSIKDKDLRMGFNVGVAGIIVFSLVFVLMGTSVDINTLVVILSVLLGVITLGVKLLRNIKI